MTMEVSATANEVEYSSIASVVARTAWVAVSAADSQMTYSSAAEVLVKAWWASLDSQASVYRMHRPRSEQRIGWSGR